MDESDVKVLLGNLIQQGINAQSQRKDLYDKVTNLQQQNTIALSEIQAIKATVLEQDKDIKELKAYKNKAMGILGFVSSGFLIAMIALGEATMSMLSSVMSLFGVK